MGEPLPVIEPQGHGKPDHCSVHGDIPRTMSIKAHIEAEHSMTYEDWRALQEAEKITDRLALLDDLHEAVTRSAFDFERRAALHELIRRLSGENRHG